MQCLAHSSTPTLPHYGINRRELDRLLSELGGSAVFLRRTGEIAYSHPALPERPRADGRRKDAPFHLVRFVRRLLALAPAQLAGLPGSSSTLEVRS